MVLDFHSPYHRPGIGMLLFLLFLFFLPQSPKNSSLTLISTSAPAVKHPGQPMTALFFWNVCFTEFCVYYNSILSIRFIMGCGVGWEGGSRGRGHMYTFGWFMLMYGRDQYNTVKQLASNENIFKTTKTFTIISTFVHWSLPHRVCFAK